MRKWLTVALVLLLISGCSEKSSIEKTGENSVLLKTIPQLLYPEYGQDYVFDGCLAFIMQCLNEDPALDYYFFAGVSGDSFTQVFGQNTNKWYQSFSHSCFDSALLDRVFSACGYKYRLIESKELTSNRGKYAEWIKDEIDRNVPVMIKGLDFFGDATVDHIDNITVIVEYEKTNGVFYYLNETSDTPLSMKLETYDDLSLVFVGEKIERPSIGDSYRKTILDIPNFMTKQADGEVSFGKQAFYDWAESLTDGRLAKIPEAEMDVWKSYGAYLCMMTNNSHVVEFTIRALQQCPDLDVVPKLLEKLQELKEKSSEISALLGGFNIAKGTLRNPYEMVTISEKIKEYADQYDEMTNLFR